MARGRVDITDFLRLAADLGIAASELEKELIGAITKASIAGLANWRLGMPVFTGEGVNTILAKGVTRKPSPAGGIVYTDLLFATAPQVIVMDEGRRPGATPPPLGPILRWVELKVGRGQIDVSWTGKTGAAAAMTAAIKLQQSIGKRGLPALRLSHKAAAVATTALEASIAEAAARLSSRIGR